MSNPSGTDHEGNTGGLPGASEPGVSGPGASEPGTSEPHVADHTDDEPTLTSIAAPERRYTAPGFDAGSTQIIDRAPDPETEIIPTPTDSLSAQDPPARTAPQEILPRDSAMGPTAPPRRKKLLVTIVLTVLAIVTAAVVGTILLTRDAAPKVSQEELVRTTIQDFDNAVQTGDLAKLRSITCGLTRDSYVSYDDRSWTETHARVSAAKQYPVVASVDQVVVNGDHAEANVTSFMAFDPATRSTRSFDLQFRDNQWKICQAS